MWVLGEREQMRLEFATEFLEKHEARTGRYFERYYSQQLMRACGAVLRTPQRLTKLSRDEELMRWVWTLRKFDEALFMSMGSDRKWLAERVVDVEGWLRGLPTAEVIMSDQMPYWVNFGREKQLYGEAELLAGRGRRG